MADTETVAILETLVRVREESPNALLSFEQKLRAADAEASRAARTIGGTLTQAQRRAADEAARLAAAEARLLQAQGNLVGAQNRLQTALSGLNTTTLRTIQLQTQLANVQQQIATGGKGLAASFANVDRGLSAVAGGLSGLAGLAGATGFAILARQAGDFTIETAKAALELQKVENVARAVTGTQSKYNELLSVAREQQRLFGGTLASNINDLTGLALTARTAGVELSDVVNIVRRLATFDPAQGIIGAQIALREALSGNITSLSRRFEIPRAALKELADESLSSAEKLRVLDDILNKAGITSDVVAGSVPQATRAFNELGAAADNVRVRIGAAFAPLLGQVASGLASFLNVGTSLKQVEASTITGAQSFADYQQRVAFVNAQLNGLLPTLTPLSEAQYRYAQSLIATGTAADVAIQKATALAPALEQVKRITEIASNPNDFGTATAEQLAAITAAAERAAVTVPNSTAAIDDLVFAWQNGALTAPQLLNALQAMTDGYLRQAAAARLASAEDSRAESIRLSGAIATERATEAVTKQAQALVDQTEKSVKAKIEAQQLASFQSTLAQLGSAVAAGHQTAGAAAVALANQYGVAISAARELVSLQVQLARATGTSALAPGVGRAGSAGFGEAASPQLLAKIQAAKAAKRAQEEYNLALGSSATKLAIYNARLAEAKRIYGANSAQAIQARQALDEYVRAQEKAAARGGGGRISAEQRTANRLQDITVAAQQKIEDAETTHQQRLLDIQAEYVRRRARAQQEFQVSELSGRRGFYQSLANVEDTGLQQSLAAQYEAAVQKAQEIAAAAGPDAAQAYLDAARQAIQERGSILGQIADAEKGKNTAKADYLRGILSLLDAETAARLDAIVKGGSEIANERDKQLADEQTKYEAQQDKIATSAERAGARAVTALQRQGKAIDDLQPKVDALSKGYDALNAPTRVAGAATAPSPTPREPPAPPTGNSLIDALNAATTAIVAAVHAVEQAANAGADRVSTAVTRGTDKVASAVSARALA